jgi:hypothetical protein
MLKNGVLVIPDAAISASTRVLDALWGCPGTTGLYFSAA